MRQLILFVTNFVHDYKVRVYFRHDYIPDICHLDGELHAPVIFYLNTACLKTN